MKNIDKKYFWAAIVLIAVFASYSFFGIYIKEAIKLVLNKSAWVNWIAGICLVLEIFHKWKYDRINFKGDNLIAFIKQCKEFIEVLVEPGILICAIHLLRGSILYMLFDQKDFFPRYTSEIALFISLVSLFAIIHSVLKVRKHALEVFLYPAKGADVAPDNSPSDE